MSSVKDDITNLVVGKNDKAFAKHYAYSKFLIKVIIVILFANTVCIAFHTLIYYQNLWHDIKPHEVFIFLGNDEYIYLNLNLESKMKGQF